MSAGPERTVRKTGSCPAAGTERLSIGIPLMEASPTRVLPGGVSSPATTRRHPPGEHTEKHQGKTCN